VGEAGRGGDTRHAGASAYVAGDDVRGGATRPAGASAYVTDDDVRGGATRPAGTSPYVAGGAVDAVVLAQRLGERLRAAGVPVTTERAARFARGLELVPPTDRARLYWTARVTLAGDRAQLDAFDRVFAAVFDAVRDPAGAPRGDPNAPRVPARPAPPGPAADRQGGGGDGPSGAAGADTPAGGGDRPVVLAAASARERLGEQRFDRLAPGELEEIALLAAGLRVATPRRASRRRRRSHRGDRLDLRATTRAALRTGEPFDLMRRRRRERPRRLVVLCDVSGSMAPYARAYLVLLRAAAGARAEVFAFATRLTRLTRALAGPDPDAALARAAAAAPDWAGGTRIADALAAFNDRHGRRGLARGAVVVILSDGWERGDPERLGEEMARLRRLAHRVIWVNPRRASAGYAPLVGGMQAALPHCDAFLSGHSLHAFEAVLDAIRDDARSIREEAGP